ncbi:MAG: hypothetical protein MUE98_07080 [Rhodobacteraceae bacterium]|jgi:hypothetical protein|nr:hypothetical protein [Paracoccaceae bacterium]
MSTPVGRPNTTSVDQSASVKRVRAEQSGEKAFKVDTSTPAAITERAPIGPGLFSQVIAEATDGDATEAAARAALGMARRDGVREEGDPNAPADETTVARGRRSQPGQDKPGQAQDNDSDPVLQSLQRRTPVKAAGGVAQSSAGTDVAKAPGATGHNQLMLLTSSMERLQVATHLAQQLTEALQGIQTQSHWAVQRSALDDLNAVQMTAVR